MDNLKSGDRIVYVLPPDKRYRPNGLRLPGEFLRFAKSGRALICLDHQPLTTRAVNLKSLEREHQVAPVETKDDGRTKPPDTLIVLCDFCGKPMDLRNGPYHLCGKS